MSQYAIDTGERKEALYVWDKSFLINLELFSIFCNTTMEGHCVLLESYLQDQQQQKKRSN